MAKKWKIGLSILITCLILVFIPIGIWAAQKLQVNVSNKVCFFVEDIEGSFYATVEGNKNGVVNPGLTTVFTAGYNQETDDYIIQDGKGQILEQTKITYDMGKVDFDKDHSVITYTFGFINSGEANILVSFNSDGESEQKFRDNNVTTTIKYEVINGIPTDSLESFGSFTQNATTLNNDRYDFSYVLVPAKGVAYPNACSYIMITYTLSINPETATSFSNNISLNISLHAQANEDINE